MARARNIKPALFKNELLGVADPLLTLLFQSLWTLADREGRLEDRPLRIKAETFPYRDCLDVNGYLTELQRLGFIVRYLVGDLALIQVVNFTKHQTPHNTEKPSQFPPVEAGTVAGCGFPDASVKPPLSDGENVNALPPDSLLLIPDSGFPIPDSPIPHPPSLAATAAQRTAPRKPAVSDTETELQAACRATWASYKDAYHARYGAEPIRNAKVNSQLKAFCQALPHHEAPAVAGFYVTHNDAFYVRKMHDPGMMVSDAAKLRTEWATGSRITATKARQIDTTGSMLDSAAEIKREMGYSQ